MRVTFSEVKRSVSRSFICDHCGKRRTRSTTLFQTLNPFNRDSAGIPKSAAQIHAELAEQAKRWRPTTCATCEAKP
jgi:hypothetical protein